MRFDAAVLFALSLIGLGTDPSYAERRVALVIGNDRYVNLPADQQLQKAANDARAVGTALSHIGFEIINGENLARQPLVAKLDEFTRRLSSGDTAFFFFAGHGVTIGGSNYILPSDVQNVDEGQETRLARDSLSESDIVADLQQRGVRVAVVVLDACRDNPFKRPGVRSVGGERGLSRVEPAQGIFTIYSAGIGQTALDRLGNADRDPNSVFTRVLVPRLTQPGVDLTELVVGLREDVARLAESVGHNQSPAYYDQTRGGRIYLAGLPSNGPANSATSPSRLDQAAQAWTAIQNTTSIVVLDEFVRQFGDTFYASVARARREELGKQGPAVAALPPPEQARPPTQPPTPPVIEARPPAMPSIAPTALPQLKWRLASSFPKSIPTTADDFTRRLREVSGGRFDYQLFAAGEIVPALQVLDAVSNGTVEAGYTAGQYYIGKDPALSFLSFVPFGFEPRQHLAWRSRPDVKGFVDRLLANYNVVGFPCGAFGRMEDLWLHKQLKAADDLKGMKLRVNGSIARILQIAGAVPAQLAGGDIYPALEKGLIDGTQWLTPRASEVLGFQRLMRYYYYPGVLTPSSVVNLIVSKPKWDALPAAGRQLLEAACFESANAMLADYETADRDALRRLVGSGTMVAPLPLPVQKRLFDAGRQFLSETANANPNFRSLLAIADSMSRETVAANLR